MEKLYYLPFLGVCDRALAAADFSAFVDLGLFSTFPADDAAPGPVWRLFFPMWHHLPLFGSLTPDESVSMIQSANSGACAGPSCVKARARTGGPPPDTTITPL